MATGTTATFLDELAIYNAGGVIPAMSNTGMVTVTVNPDQSHTVSALGPTGMERVHIEWTSPDVYQLTADQNADGTTDETMTSTSSGGIVTLVWQKDTNLDGTFDWVDTMTQSKEIVSSYIQQIPAGGTALVATSAYTASSLEQFCEGCDPVSLSSDPASGYAPDPGYCTSPTPPEEPCSGDDCCAGVPCADLDGYSPSWKTSTLTTQEVFAGSIRFSVILSGPMMCTPTQIGQLATALGHAGHDFDTWVGAINATLHDDVYAHLGNEQIFYGCAIPSAYSGQSVLAVTTKAFFTDDPSVSSPRSRRACMPPGSTRCRRSSPTSGFHAAGMHHQVDAAGSESRDVINACARVGDQCKAWNVGFYLGKCCDASSARDGAMCASAENKQSYGGYEMYVETASPYVEEPSGATDPATNVCADTDGNAADALCAIESMFAFCDQTPFTAGETTDPIPSGYPSKGQEALPALSGFVCVEECPAMTPDTPSLCATNLPPTAIPPMDPEPPQAAGPTPFWRSPAFAVQAKGSSNPFNGQAGSQTTCGPVTYAAQCAY